MKITQVLSGWIDQLPIPPVYEEHVLTLVSVGLILVGAIISYYVVKRILVGLINAMILKTATDLDDVLVKRKVFNRLAYFAPGWLIHELVPVALVKYPMLSAFVAMAAAVYLVAIVVLLVDSLLDSLLDIYHTFSASKKIPIRNFVQVIRLTIYFIAFIVIMSLALDESPLKLFAGLGAMTAVLMLIFKDPILGFVAGLQLSYNNMVSVGDWVEIPQHDADGDIMEIGLTTVKVRNFDNTTTTVPTQSLINESFKNWRSMQDSSGRRIKRAIYIDVNSIQFCDEEALERYSKVDYIKEYIDTKQREVEEHNQKSVGDAESLVNGRRLTNIGTFRAYILAYLRNHPSINQNLTLIVRQLRITDSGLPLEIYTFSSEKNWAKYEAIQADIFDHLFAVAREFDLRIFQKPSGVDLQTIRGIN